MKKPDRRQAESGYLGSTERPEDNTAPSPLVHLQQGVPVTDSLAISREFARRHDNVLQSLDSLIADGTINHLDFKEVEYTDAKGEKRRMLVLTERGALVAMPFIGGRTAGEGRGRLLASIQQRRQAGSRQCATADDRLLHLILSGECDRLRPDDVPQAQRALLDALAARNRVLISSGRNYEQRKAVLPGFAAKWLAAHPSPGAV